MCVQATYWTQTDGDARRLVVHLFNGVNTAANHGLPASEAPLREETVPVGGIEVRFRKDAPKTLRMEPGGERVEATAGRRQRGRGAAGGGDTCDADRRILIGKAVPDAGSFVIAPPCRSAFMKRRPRRCSPG